jgi:hypothetical protein
MEHWADISGFDQYSISSQGRVRRNRDGRLMAISFTNGGIAFVSLSNGGRQYSKAVAPLVAEAFLEEPEDPCWDTPIHLNGDRSDNRAENLMWRPRWYAIYYHKDLVFYDGLDKKVRDVDSGEVLTIQEMAMKYGLRPMKIFMVAANYGENSLWESGVWPTGQRFELV